MKTKKEVRPMTQNGLRFIGSTIMGMVPLVLIGISAFLIAIGSWDLFSDFIGSPNPFKTVSKGYAYLGFGLLLLTTLITFSLIRKKLSTFIAIPSLIINFLLISFILIVIASPIFDYLISNVLFRKGFCQYLNYISTSYPANNETQNEVTTFCTSASKLFHFSYP